MTSSRLLAGVHFSWAKKRIAEVEQRAKREIDDLKLKLREAQEAAEKAQADAERAIAEAAQATSEADEIVQTHADMEGRAAQALSELSWAKEHRATAQRERAEAEAKIAELQAALDEARNEIEAAIDIAAEGESGLTDARRMIEELRNQLSEAIAGRDDDARERSAEIHRLRNEMRQIPGLFDATFQRNADGLLTEMSLKVGADAFTVVPIRNPAGHIVEMRTTPESLSAAAKLAPKIPTALDADPRQPTKILTQKFTSTAPTALDGPSRATRA
jgi:predicted  nucleic acid-binding Zn-ribbon protein